MARSCSIDPKPPNAVSAVVHHASMEFDIVGIAYVEGRDAVIDRLDLMIKAALKDRDTCEHKVALRRIIDRT